MNYVIVDFEMNAVANQYKEERAICNMEIIEIGAVYIENGKPIKMEIKDTNKNTIIYIIYNEIEINI